MLRHSDQVIGLTVVDLATAAVSLESVVGMVRGAFATSDPYPGLPKADGCADAVSDLRDELRRGYRAWVALAAGEPVGAVRAVPAATSWVIRRLAVAPGHRGRGVAERLVRVLESAALAAGARWVTLEAVVERGNPLVYNRLGYAVWHHLPAPDKPLSEVHMRRAPGTDATPLLYPRAAIGRLPRPGWIRCWFSGGTGTWEVGASWSDGSAASVLSCLGRARHALPPGARPVGADAVPVAPAWDGLRARWYDRPPAELARYRMPRWHEPDALALWRHLPGHAAERGSRPATDAAGGGSLGPGQ